MHVGLIGRAVGLFAATNTDDLLVLTLFFGQAAGRAGALRVAAGQYLGFAGILAVAVVGALGAVLLPEGILGYLGLVPLFLGLRAVWVGLGRRNQADVPGDALVRASGPSLLVVAGVTLANGGDNIGVYVPVFATSGTGTLVVYVTVFLILVAIWCAAGYWAGRHPLVAGALSRWGHVLLPVVLIGIGLVILVEGSAFGL